MTGLYDRKPGDPTSQSNAEATLPEHPHGHEREYGRQVFGKHVHGHMNNAVFYVLKGRGHDVRDSKRFD
jgi:mannose-6-phosphate isomerase-like protein (cupin superfamily)